METTIENFNQITAQTSNKINLVCQKRYLIAGDLLQQIKNSHIISNTTSTTENQYRINTSQKFHSSQLHYNKN